MDSKPNTGRNRFHKFVLIGALSLLCMAAVPLGIVSLHTYDSVAEMAANANPNSIIKVAWVRGYAQTGDGGDGMFYATNTVTLTNAGTRVKALVGSGTWSWERKCDKIDVRYFGATPNDTTIDTVNIQRAIDAGLESERPVVIPVGIFLVDDLLTLSYYSYDETTGLTSSTHATPYLLGPSRQSFTLMGEANPSKRLARIDTSPRQTYNNGSVLVATNGMSGKAFLRTGFWSANTRVQDITFVGLGIDVAGQGVYVNVSATHTKIDRCHFVHVNNPIAIGADKDTYADVHADYTYIVDSSCQFADTFVKISNGNAYQTIVERCHFESRIGIDNSLGSRGTTPSPPVKVNGGFWGGEDFGVLITGTVASVSGTNLTLNASMTKSYKVRDENFALYRTNINATITDITTNMWIVVEKNCNAIGASRHPFDAVENKIYAVDTGGGIVGVDGTVDGTVLAGRNFYAYTDVTPFLGDNFDVEGFHGEQTQAGNFGIPYKMARLVGFNSSSVFRKCFFNANAPDYDSNRAIPFFYHKPFYAFHGFPVRMEECVFRVNYWRGEVTPEANVETINCVFQTQPIFRNHNGTPANGVRRQGDTVFCKLPTTFGFSSAELRARVGRMGKDRYSIEDGILRRNLVTTDAAPTEGRSGEFFLVNNASSQSQIFKIAAVSGLQGYVGTRTITETATIVTGTDPTIATLSAMDNIEDGDIITIAGAGPAAGALTTQVVRSQVSSNGSTRTIWLYTAASTDVSGAAISAVAATIESRFKFGTATETTSPVYILGSSGGGPLVTLERTDGVSARFELNFASGHLTFRDALNSRDRFRFPTSDSRIAAELYAGLLWQEQATDPTAALVTSGSNAKDRVLVYMKNDKLVFAYNNAGTVTFISIPMDGSTATWTHSTTAP